MFGPDLIFVKEEGEATGIKGAVDWARTGIGEGSVLAEADGREGGYGVGKGDA